MNAYSQYQQNQIISSSPEQILLMLYDGAIRFTRQAAFGLEEENYTVFHHGLKKSMAIITEFSNSLDHAIGGEIAENLDALYSFMIRELTLANLHKNLDKLKVVENLLVDLRATWAEAIETNHREQMPLNRLVEKTAAPAVGNSPPDGYVPLSISR
jgi:flagellar secretion chaperone FliS